MNRADEVAFVPHDLNISRNDRTSYGVGRPSDSIAAGFPMSIMCTTPSLWSWKEVLLSLITILPAK